MNIINLNNLPSYVWSDSVADRLPTVLDTWHWPERNHRTHYYQASTHLAETVASKLTYSVGDIIFR